MVLPNFFTNQIDNDMNFFQTTTETIYCIVVCFVR